MDKIKIWGSLIKIFPSINEVYNNGNIKVIEEKNGVGNSVTSLDKMLESHINTQILSVFKNANIISEESSDKQIKKDGLNFIIDPLDGTTNYINGWPHTVSIGVINDNELIVGAIFDILNKKVYSAIKD